jgi:hypothetical protein
MIVTDILDVRFMLKRIDIPFAAIVRLPPVTMFFYVHYCTKNFINASMASAIELAPINIQAIATRYRPVWFFMDAVSNIQRSQRR